MDNIARNIIHTHLCQIKRPKSFHEGDVKKQTSDKAARGANRKYVLILKLIEVVSEDHFLAPAQSPISVQVRHSAIQYGINSLLLLAKKDD